MKVWMVMETADYTTVHVFETEALAREWIGREDARRAADFAEMGLPLANLFKMWDVEEMPVLTELPPERA